MKTSGAEIIIKLLEIHGIQTIAGIPGGANLPMYDALVKSGKIHHVLARHEQGAGFIAQGQARSTGEVGVFFATSGPGATNALTAIADAKLDSVPIICITGQVPQSLIGTDAFQEIDTYGLSVPITKHNYFVRSARELLDIIPDAFELAKSGRPGPVLIDVPKDVQNELIEIREWPVPVAQFHQQETFGDHLREMAKLISKSERPIVYVGGGIIQSETNQELLELVERLNAPTTTTLMGLGALPSNHCLNIGMLGMHAAKYTNMLLEECDCLIALGVRFDDRATGKLEAFCPNATIVHIDIDPSEIGKLKQPTISLAADLSHVLDAWLPLLPKKSNKLWINRMKELRSRYPLDLGDLDNPFSPYGILMKTADALEKCTNFIVTTDVGQHQMRVAQAFPFYQPRQLLTSGGLGTMGFGLPAAIGAAIENPEATVICFTGDGSLLMNIQELALITEENLNVKVIVSNNQSLGLVHQQQQLFYEKRKVACEFKQNADFVMIARAFGVEAYDLNQSSHPEELINELIQKPGGVLINVPIDVSAHVFPMVPPGGENREMLDSHSLKLEEEGALA